MEADRPLRVLMTAARFFPAIGGIETHVYQVGRRLAEAGVDLTVVTTDPTGKLPRDDDIAGIKVRRVRSWPAESDYYFAPAMDMVIRAGEWDIVHCQGCHTFVASIAMLSALRARRPYVLTFHSGGHSSRLRTRLRPLQWWVLRPLLARARKLVCVSSWEEQFFRRRLGLPGKRFRVIPNGTQFAKLPSSVRDSAADPVIVSVGRLERYKGHHRVLEALPTVRRSYPNVRLRIVGAGPYESRLRGLASRLGVLDSVEIGPIPSNDSDKMVSVLSNASLVTLLSEYESQGIAALEALALGRPLLVAQTSALAELTDQGLARGLPLESTAEEVARAVLGELEQPLVRSGFQLPTWDSCAERLLALYHEVLEPASCTS